MYDKNLLVDHQPLFIDYELEPQRIENQLTRIRNQLQRWQLKGALPILFFLNNGPEVTIKKSGGIESFCTILENCGYDKPYIYRKRKELMKLLSGLSRDNAK